MLKSYNFSAKDNFNSIAGEAMQSHQGESYTIVGAAIDERPDENGEARKVGLLVAEDGTVFTGISETAIRGIDMLIDSFEENDGEPVNIMFEGRSAKSGRTFIVLKLV